MPHDPSPVNCVQPGSFLTLHYRLSGPDGAAVVNTFDDKPATLSLGAGQLAPAMESRLIGLAEGAHQTFTLAPGEAFGERNPEMLQRVARSLLQQLGAPDEDYAPGDVVSWDLDGKGMTHIGIVSNMYNSRSGRPLIIHNIGGGVQREDRLFDWKITGHYRYF